jgi:acyl-CoA thioesterase I
MLGIPNILIQKINFIMKNFFYLLFLFVVFFSNCKNTTEKTPTQPTQIAVEKTANSKKNIVFFGNSLTAGYGLENVADGFVSLIQNRIDSLNLAYRCINAGLSGETTAGGADRVAWIIDQQPIDVFILELGGNDALRGINPESSLKNLQIIIDKVKAKHPSVKIVLAGMEAPRNMGKTYIQAFHDMYPTLAKKNNLPLIPFILDKVGGVKEMNQADGIHPTAQGNKIIVETIWQTLKPLL